MPQVLVVDDAPDQGLLVAGLLQNAGFSTAIAADGAEALAAMEQSCPEIVVTDLIMPGIDGLQLVEMARSRFPTVPVILITAHGSGEIAVKALKSGAASYVPKRQLTTDLISTVEDVLSLASERRQRIRLYDFLKKAVYSFELDNDQVVINGLTSFLQDRLRSRFNDHDENVFMQVGMAVREGLRNAMHHGNLEVSSDLRDESGREYDAKIRERLQEPEFNRRRVVVEVEIDHHEFSCRIRDEGPGFDPVLVPDPTDPSNVLRSSGRGLYLISAFMDQVEHNEIGNEILMVKHFDDVRGSD